MYSIFHAPGNKIIVSAPLLPEFFPGVPTTLFQPVLKTLHARSRRGPRVTEGNRVEGFERMSRIIEIIHKTVYTGVCVTQNRNTDSIQV
jgi:hypothetical protein